MVGISAGMITDAYAQKPEASLDWSIKTSKKIFYPGEPLLLTVKISNTGKEEEWIYFGGGGIEAFSMEIHDNSNNIVAKGPKIQRGGFSTETLLKIPPGKIGGKPVVLNRWCSTLLPPGKYHVICNVEYWLQSEATRIPGTEKGFRVGPLHRTQLDSYIELIKPDASKYKEILDKLTRRDVKREGQSSTEWQQDQELTEDMIAFTEWELAVPYELRILKDAKRTWLKRDVIKSLIRSETLEAATGLMQIVEDASLYKEDVKCQLIDAVYKLRETGKPEIIKGTDEFVSKYKRPVMAKPID